MILKKEIQKIYKKIDSISKLGKDGYFDYCILIDNLIQEGKYGILELAMSKRYFINIDNYLSVNDMKKDTYKVILFSTNIDIAKRVKSLYDTNGLYQISYNIYQLSNNTKLGEIKEIDRMNVNNRPVIDEAGAVVIDLEVLKGLTMSTITNGDTLYDKYVSAVTLLTT